MDAASSRGPSVQELPLVGRGDGPDRVGPRRADAIRNEQRVLEAAAAVFADKDPAQVTMSDLARAAGIGRATLYRSFPDPQSVAIALLDKHERQLQAELLSGKPPLGPGAEPAARLAAFYTAMVELLDRHLHLALGAETGPARFRVGAYGFWRTHVRALLAEAGTSEPDVLTDLLLAPLAPEVYRYQRSTHGLRQERIIAGLIQLAEAVLRPG